MRGKKAAGAAHRQASRTSDQVIAFQAAIGAEKAGRVADGVAHAAELADLRSEIRERAAELAAETMAAEIETEVARRVVATLRSTNEARAREVFGLLHDALPGAPLLLSENSTNVHSFLAISEALGVPHLAGELTSVFFGAGHQGISNRPARRRAMGRISKQALAKQEQWDVEDAESDLRSAMHRAAAHG